MFENCSMYDIRIGIVNRALCDIILIWGDNMAKKRRRSGKKRTITPEHLAKMQEGRRRAKVHRERLAALKEKGMDQDLPVSEVDRLLNSVKRK